tara:strand:- start:481 stop:750 length:270 start_codon:yes stop_codon:yes gene_type:complete
MASLNIRFNDEYPKQTTYRIKFINLIKKILSEEPDLLGTSLTFSTYGKKGKNISFRYRSGKYQTEKINELDECSDFLNTINSYATKVEI